MLRKWKKWGFAGSRVLAVVALILVALAHGKVAQAQDEAIDPDVAEAVMAVMQEVIDAFMAQDADRIYAVMTDPFVYVDREGAVGGREEFAFFPEGVEFTAIDATDVQMVALSPETVLVTAQIAVEGTYGGETWADNEVDSFTFVLRDGEWLMASIHAGEAKSDEERTAEAIASALSAAPSAVGAGATVMAPSPDGTVTVLQEGDNGFTCIPDDPNSEIADPICLDDEAVKMFDAFMSGGEPVFEGLGVMFMLQGTASASASDPMVMAPAEGEEWVIDGPNIRLVAPDGFDEEVFPTEPTDAGPYIMWSGTPFEHLVIPAGDAATGEEMGAME